ncbi:Hypothetical protein, putative, partial [Bodo saltans]
MIPMTPSLTFSALSATEKQSALFLAAQEGRSAGLGVSVLSMMPNFATPMLYAAAGGHVNAIQTLASFGGLASSRLVDGATPLFLAAQSGH